MEADVYSSESNEQADQVDIRLRDCLASEEAKEDLDGLAVARRRAMERPSHPTVATPAQPVPTPSLAPAPETFLRALHSAGCPRFPEQDRSDRKAVRRKDRQCRAHFFHRA